ncbi:Alpha subunit of chaperonin-containing T-complex [Cyanidiococcus yangmingshanensis]|uniref:Alpha subunit of chaperonin-containing T-complex n=1 Tax=Cyanidiococcus yangmingshanensis TaxID=2690220 RepID=A0A7J7IPW7_9RHOD|nr:Alpha subunit of chaperonin-containing T-complex [Cyanidiococcus yangmingshanensis]
MLAIHGVASHRDDAKQSHASPGDGQADACSARHAPHGVCRRAKSVPRAATSLILFSLWNARHEDRIGNMPALALDGERVSGRDVRTQNVNACQAVANVVKSSLGPVGLDKMLVSEIGDVTVTNDGATILSLLEVKHPAAKVLVDLARQQDEEVGDGTTTVVILAAELLKRGHELFKSGLHPTSIVAGYKLAVREACKYIRDRLSVPVDRLGRECLVNAAKTSLQSKVLGGEVIDHFAGLAVDAVLAVKTRREDGVGGYRYPIQSINILKSHGRGVRESALLGGYGLNLTRASRLMPERVTNARVACLDVDLRRAKRPDAEELHKMQERELDITRERIGMILKAGANVLFTTKGIDDSALKYISDAGATDLKRIAKCTGATIQTAFADLNGEESFDASALGQAQEVVEEIIADSAFTFIRGCRNLKAATILLRGPNEFMLDEMERSIHDALSAVRRTLESNMVVAGGGATEAAVSTYLESFAAALGSREQLATLAVNAALDATDLVAKLRAAHFSAFEASEGTAAIVDTVSVDDAPMTNGTSGADAIQREELKFCGLDLTKGRVRNSFTAGVLEPAMSKIKSIQFATEAAITILPDRRLDQDHRSDRTGGAAILRLSDCQSDTRET